MSARPITGVEHRCADGRPCVEVVDRLHAAETAVLQLGIDPTDPAIEALRWRAERTAEAHDYGQQRS